MKVDIKCSIRFVHDESAFSRAHGFFYACVPKVATRSILAMLESEVSDLRKVGECLPQERLFDSKEFSSLFSFAFIRNPVSRILSFYFDKIYNYRATPGQQALFAAHKGLVPGMEIDAFFDWLCSKEGRDEKADPHYMSQSLFLLNSEGEQAVQNVFKLEVFHDVWPLLSQKIGLSQGKIAHLNSNSDDATRKNPVAPEKKYREVLSDKLLEQIKSRYKMDFEILDYSADLNGCGDPCS